MFLFDTGKPAAGPSPPQAPLGKKFLHTEFEEKEFLQNFWRVRWRGLIIMDV
jgi:hypothetical protein